MTSLIKSGDRFGTLTVIRRSRPNYVLCKCGCGNEREIQIGKLTCQWTKSCGCLQRKKAKKSAEIINHKRRQSMLCRQFGQLTVTKISHWKTCGSKKQGRRYYYVCKCSCGKNKTVLGDNLTSGNTKSCGCLQHQKGRPSPTRLLKGEASLRACFRVYKAKALKQGLPFGLDLPAFKHLTSQPCFYCGAVPSNVAKHPNRFGGYVYNGIDRIDNSKGYTAANCVPCCKQSNIAKNNHNLEDFIDWIKRVHARLPKIQQHVNRISSN